MDKIKNLLEKVEILTYRYEKLNKKQEFNIFTTLLRPSDEVKLHSRFIFELLNPLGKHAFGDLFLNAFFEELNIIDFEKRKIEVFREYKNIDLLIQNDNQALVIENKIWAPDQDRQLERYYTTMKDLGKKSIRLFYLTLDGKEPTSISLGNLIKKKDLDEILYLISYQENVRNWIKKCGEIAFSTPSIREALIQYLALIDLLTGNNISMVERNELMELLSKGENILSAKKLVDNWIHVRWHLEYDFWIDLEGRLSNKGFSILNLDKFSDLRLNNVYHQRKKNPWYGLIIEIQEVDERDKLCLYIERGDGNLYFVMNIVRDGTIRNICLENKFDVYATTFQVDSDFPRTKFCLGGKFYNEEINFNNPHDENTLLLRNSNNRKRVIDSILEEIEEYLDKRIKIKRQ